VVIKFLKAFFGDSPFLAVALLAISLSASLGNGVHTPKSLHNQGIKLSSCSNDIGLMLLILKSLPSSSPMLEK